MPAYIVLRQPGGLAPLELLFQAIKKPDLASIAEDSRKGEQRGLKQAIEQKKPWVQKLYSKDRWIVRNLNIKDAGWKQSNLIFILPAVTAKEIHLKSSEIETEREMMKQSKDGQKLRKECFVTVGATATFEQLIQAALSREVFAKLKEKGFTHVNYQYGESFTLFHEVKPEDTLAIEVGAFGFKKEGLKEDIKKCKRVAGQSEEGLVISHAGEPFSSNVNF